MMIAQVATHAGIPRWDDGKKDGMYYKTMAKGATSSYDKAHTMFRKFLTKRNLYYFTVLR